MRLRPVGLVLLLALFVTAPAWAQGSAVRVVASIDVAGPTTDDDVRYDVEVQGAAIEDVGQPRLPALTGLEPVVLAPVVTRIEGTGVTPRVRFRWTLRPTLAGRARIGEAFVPVGGQLVASNPIAFVVRPGAARTPPTAQAPARSVPGRSRLTPSDVFVRARRVPPGAVWQGEQVVVEWQLYARPDLDLNYRIVDAGSATGFWREDLPVDRNAAPSIVRIGGRPYSTLVIRRLALFPQQAGTLTVAPVRIEGTARVPIGAALFGLDDAPRLDEAFTRTSDDLSVVSTVRPPAPPAFSGLTGDVDVRATVAAPSVRVGEGVEVTVTVTGDAALSTMSPPRLDVPPARADVFDAQSDSTRRIAGERFRGTRTFRYTVVPRTEGPLDLPPIVLTRFDVRTRRYVREEAALGHVTVTPGLPSSAAQARATEQRPSSVRPQGRQTAWLVGAMGLGLAVMLLGCALAWRRRAETRAKANAPASADSGRQKRSATPATTEPPRAASAAAVAGTRSIERQVLDALGVGDTRRAADLARRHLASGIARRLDRPVLPASPLALRRALDEAGVPNGQSDALVALLDRLTTVAYAPGSADGTTVGPLVQQALDAARHLAD